MQPVRPATAADDSFTGGATVMPPGAREVGIDLDPGDVLFFAGATIHGSHRNTTSDRFRRAFICHYVGDRAIDFAPEAGRHMTHLAP